MKPKNELEIISQQESRKFFTIRESQLTLRMFDIYLNMSEINSDDDDVSDLIHCLRTATEDDTIRIFINNPGGCIYTIYQILNAMNDCQASITTVADGFVCSAATFIFLAGDTKIVKQNSTFLFHCCHMSDGDGLFKFPDKLTELRFSKNNFESFWHRYYDGFFTNEEIEKMLDGKDYWLSSEEVLQRLSNTQTD